MTVRQLYEMENIISLIESAVSRRAATPPPPAGGDKKPVTEEDAKNRGQG